MQANLNEAKQALLKYFGYSSFRPLQEDIIQTVLEGKDSVVLMPTGGGKSICYQIPAIVLEGICIVVSPLISLMKDQVDGLKANGIKAGLLNSSLNSSQQTEVESQALKGGLDILYVSPEKLVTHKFLSFIKQLNVCLIAIDEAHCISSWGHDFRPEYTQLKILKAQLNNIPVIALTATADKLTRQDIIKQLDLKDPEVFLASFDRPNLSLTVLPGRNRFKVLLEFIRNRKGQPGIIYCLSRRSTEQVAQKLRDQGVLALHYHAGMTAQERTNAQEAFVNDKVPVVCATIAFGMGIDKSNVRWIIHYNLPKNMESYYQEIGRAGRDGLKADTLLFYSLQDVIQLKYFINESERKQIELAKLQRMQQYAESLNCRRKILLSYFGEVKEEDCGNCDVCSNPPSMFNGTVVAQKALSAVARTKENVPAGLLIDILRGSSKQDILANNFHEIKTYGTGKDISYEDWQLYLMQMLNMGLIEVAYDDGHKLKLTEASKHVLFKNKPVNLVQLANMKEAQSNAYQPKKKTKQQLFEEGLFETLRQLRLEISREEGLAAYQVFSDATLSEMVEQLPVAPTVMKKIKGMGDRKFQLYGRRFMLAIQSYLIEQNSQGIKVKGSTYLVTYAMIKRGLSPEQIARERGNKSFTIYSHIARLYRQGYDVDVTKFLTPAELNEIIEAIEKTGFSEALKELFDHFDGKMDYHKLQMAAAYYERNNLVEN